jgi:hypothetical protein
MSHGSTGDLFGPRLVGDAMGALCEDKATAAGFDSAGAEHFIVCYLAVHGRCSGEKLVNEAIAAGFVPHDARAFGPIFARLVRAPMIRCVGTEMRTKGHGTAGARIWTLL